MFKEEYIVDGRGHIMGRMASYVAKELLNGQKITVVRCELLNISGSLFRNQLKFKDFKRKRTNTNPKRGPFHHLPPSIIFLRTVRGMLPRKTARGQAALDRLKVFDGIPHPYDTKKRFCVSNAVTAVRLKPHRKFTVLGDLSKSVGWKCKDIIEKLSKKRAVKGTAHFGRVIAKSKLMQEARKKASESKVGKPAAKLIEKLLGWLASI